MTQMDYQIIAQNIRKYRILHKLTQEKMAEYLGIDTLFYAQLEQNRRNFTIERIFDACNALQIRIEDVVPINHSDDDSKETADALCAINEKLSKCNSKQLMLIDKFIDDIASLL